MLWYVLTRNTDLRGHWWRWWWRWRWWWWWWQRERKEEEEAEPTLLGWANWTSHLHFSFTHHSHFRFSRTFTFLTFYMYSYISTFTLLSCCFTLTFCFPSPTFISLSWKGVFFILSLFPCLFSGLSQCVPLPLCAVSWPCFLCRNTAPWLITLWMKGHVCLQTNNTTLSVKWRRVYLLHTVYTYHSIYTL